MPANGQCEFY